VFLAGAGVAAWPGRAEACGGFFCATVPVVQTGEEIVFVVDDAAGEVDVTIKIAYSGPAAEFAWLLPLLKNPTRIGLGTEQSFQMIDGVTSARFTPRITRSGCDFPGNLQDASSVADSSFSGDAGASPGVLVLQQSNVGAFESVVLSGNDPEAIRTWLVEHDYRVTDEMMQAVFPYVAKGDVLLALRLQSGKSVGELQPISLTIPSPEPCIPLRLTAIAAQDDMDVTAVVFSKNGRAIPQNFLHVELNPSRIAWLSGGSNWRSLVSEAADDAGGNAFATEWAGAASELSGRISSFTPDLSLVRSATLAGSVTLAIGDTGLSRRSETSGILRGILTDELLQAAGVNPQTFWICPWCDPVGARLPLDGARVAAQLDERILQPEARLQAKIDGMTFGTRLYTVLSPKEMNVDPIFAFRTDLPPVAAQREANVFVTCSSGAAPRVEVEIDGQRRVADASGVVWSSGPAAVQIANLFTREIVSTRDPLPSAAPRPQSSSCQETGPIASSAWVLGLLAVCLLRVTRGAGGRARS
jgi:hypothetical protein